MALIDKALRGGEEIALTPSGDFAVVEDNATYLQAAQHRCIATLGSWIHDPLFGSVLLTSLKGNSVAALVTENEIKTLILDALQPMLQDGRLKDLVSVQIVQRNDTDIYLEVVVDIGTQIGTIVFQVNP